eukprot:765736-Hanusia_phi.AAC.3
MQWVAGPVCGHQNQMNIPDFWVGVKRQQGNILKTSITKRKKKAVSDESRPDPRKSVKKRKRNAPKVDEENNGNDPVQPVNDLDEEDDDFVEVESLAEETGVDASEPVERSFDSSLGLVHSSPQENEETAHDTLYNELRCCIKSNADSRQVDRCLILDSIISRQPYVKMMQNLFGAYDDSCFNQVEPVKIVTKAYEEMHMRECVEAHERPCAMGSSCECMFIDSNLPFTCVEFILPNEEPQPEPQLCVLCLRKLTQSMYYDVMYRHGKFNGVIQNHGNICEVPNEYSRTVMLICPPCGPVHCMPLPIVAHQRNRYSVYIDYMVIPVGKPLVSTLKNFSSTKSQPSKQPQVDTNGCKKAVHGRSNQISLTQKYTVVHSEYRSADIFPIHDSLRISDADCMTYDLAIEEFSRASARAQPVDTANGARHYWFCKEDPILDHYIRRMHEDLKQGVENAQVMIDRSLISCWIARKFPDVYARIPHEARLLHPSVHLTEPDAEGLEVEPDHERDLQQHPLLEEKQGCLPFGGAIRGPNRPRAGEHPARSSPWALPEHGQAPIIRAEGAV